MAIWLSAMDLQNATSPQAMIACFDDAVNGTRNQAAIDFTIDRAEQELLSYLADEFGPPPIAPGVLTQLGADNFLKYAALDFAVAFMKERRMEYFKINAEDLAAIMKRAQERATRIVQARQRPPTVATKPANVGGVVVDNGPRIAVDSADGTYNGGDY